jgi:hypothetical protein
MILFSTCVGILVFERIHNQDKFDLIHAISQCTLNKSPGQFDYGSSPTLQAACSVIETHPKLTELRTALVAKIKTCFYCHACRKMSDALQTEGQQVFLFMLNSSNKVIAYPIVSKPENDLDICCTLCNYSSKNVKMQPGKQMFLECPNCLIVRTRSIDVSH